MLATVQAAAVGKVPSMLRGGLGHLQPHFLQQIHQQHVSKQHSQHAQHAQHTQHSLQVQQTGNIASPSPQLNPAPAPPQGYAPAPPASRAQHSMPTLQAPRARVPAQIVGLSTSPTAGVDEGFMQPPGQITGLTVGSARYGRREGDSDQGMFVTAKACN